MSNIYEYSITYISMEKATYTDRGFVAASNYESAAKKLHNYFKPPVSKKHGILNMSITALANPIDSLDIKDWIEEHR